MRILPIQAAAGAIAARGGTLPESELKPEIDRNEASRLSAQRSQDDFKRSIVAQAKAAGIRNLDRPSLEMVDKRRTQLWIVMTAVLLATSATLVTVSLFASAADRRDLVDATAPWLKWVLIGCSAVFCLYVIDRELALRKLERSLIDERVMTAALSNRLKELSALADAGKAINSILELDDVLGIILSAALGLLGGSEGSIMLMDEDGEHLELYTFRGSTDRYKPSIRVPVDQGIAGHVVQNREPLVISGTPDPGDFPGWIEKKVPIHSAMCVPLISRGEVLGVLNINDTVGGRDFNDYDVRTLKLFADHASVAISNARMFETEKDHVNRLVELDRMKSEFVATVSHELRTPLTSVLGAAATLKRNRRLDESAREEFLNMIERQGNRLLRLVEDILFASKIEAGESPLQIEKINVGAVVAEAATDLHARPGGDRIVIALPDSPLIAYADIGAVQQVLLNLIENAFKYGGTKGKITVTGRDIGDYIEIGVSDEGPGIAPEDQKFIFERFRQADSSIKRKSVGVGLGLYIVRNLVEGQRGHLRLVSDVGEGAEFIFTLPKQPPDTTDESNSAGSIAEAQRKGNGPARAGVLNREEAGV